MDKVKSWQPVYRMLKRHQGNSIIDKRNAQSIETYERIEAYKETSKKYGQLEGLYIRRRGDRV